EKATHWVAFLRLGETNLLLMLALKPLEVLTSQLPNFFLLLTTRLIYLILWGDKEPRYKAMEK
ncbi:hypothetical protein OKT22_16950, partial [Providencia rettgeri]|uniref:hypothetical protein n=1 Tax=Providencia rettgeri TaxID=587 RepID=UPI00226E8126